MASGWSRLWGRFRRRPEVAQPDIAQPEVAQPEVARPEVARPSAEAEVPRGDAPSQALPPQAPHATGPTEPSDPPATTPPAHPPADETVMQNDANPTNPVNPEASPRQALSAYNVEDGVAGLSPKANSPTSSVARIYARALLEMAQETGQLDTIASEAAQLEDLLDQQPELRQLLTSPAVSKSDRRGLLERVFRGKLNETLYRFLQVVNAKNRLQILPEILRAFRQLFAEHRGIITVEAHVAKRLDSTEADEVARRIGDALGKQVVLHQHVDPALIGGLTLRYGDRLIDGSVAAQLRNMRKQLVLAGRERARQQSV